MATQGGAIGRVLLVVAFLVAAYVWLSRQREDLAFWFPQEPAGREKPEQNLAPVRSWRTLIVFAVYLLVWYMVLIVET
jgi:hypothetical protein